MNLPHFVRPKKVSGEFAETLMKDFEACVIEKAHFWHACFADIKVFINDLFNANDNNGQRVYICINRMVFLRYMVTYWGNRVVVLGISLVHNVFIKASKRKTRASVVNW